MLFWDDYGVALYMREDVEERNGLLAFIYFVTWYLSCNYFTENAIRYFRHNLFIEITYLRFAFIILSYLELIDLIVLSVIGVWRLL